MRTIEIRDRQELTDTLGETEVRYVVHDQAELQLHFTPPAGGIEGRRRIVDLHGRGARAMITGAWRGTRHAACSVQLDIDHASPETWSRTDIRAVLDDDARFVFTGMLHIRPGAAKSDTFLRQDSLLLSPRARADATPSLEIEADDVKAGHAATAKPIDREQLFYLRCRGILPTEASNLLIEAFLTHDDH